MQGKYPSLTATGLEVAGKTTALLGSDPEGAHWRCGAFHR